MNTIQTIQTELLAKLKLLLASIQQQQAATTPHAPATTDPILYQKAVECIDKHITLNPSVPSDVGCAEAISYVMSLVPIVDGSEGIAGTAALDAWLKASPLFTQSQTPQVGAIIVSPTGQGNGTVEGHTGIVAKFNLQYPEDWGILSNNSLNGLFQEQWSLSAWLANYHVKGALPVNYYVYNG